MKKHHGPLDSKIFPNVWKIIQSILGFTSESSALELSDMEDLRDDSVDLLDSDDEDSDESFGFSVFSWTDFAVSTFGVVRISNW